MKLEIITPSTMQTHIVAWVELNTEAGSFVIQKGHAPMTVPLAKNQHVVFRLQTGTQESLIAHSGVAQVSRTAVVLLLESMKQG